VIKALRPEDRGFRVPMRLDFFPNLPNPSGRTTALGSTQSLNRNEYQESFKKKTWG
jgi:hypothetical protein